MQPAYIPWLGYFDRVAASDLHIVLDHVSMDINSKTKFTNRNKVRTKDGWTWLTVPLKSKGKYGQLFIDQLEVVEDKWNIKHWKSIENCYRKAPYFEEHGPALQDIFLNRPVRLVDFITLINDYLFSSLNIPTKRANSSEMNVAGDQSDLILNLCVAAGATKYISGPFGRDYLDQGSFDAKGIEILYHDYDHPQYSQVYEGFEPYMSVLDLLFNHGPESSAIITSQRPVSNQ
jgi:hypothetical protein